MKPNAAPPTRAKGWFWCSLSGYTSFVAHSGGPPLTVYLLPQKLDKTVLTNNTDIAGAASFLPAPEGDPAGRQLHFGIREHAMGSMMNGVALHGRSRIFGGTFLVFSDYMRPAVRMAALMGLLVALAVRPWTGELAYLAIIAALALPFTLLRAVDFAPDGSYFVVVASGFVAEHEVLGLTFTRKAAGELRTRLARLGVRESVTAGTFHAIALAAAVAALRQLGLRPAAEDRADAVVRGTVTRYDPDQPIAFQGGAATGGSGRMAG